METGEMTNSLGEPITKWWQWLAVFSPFLLFLQIYLYGGIYRVYYYKLILGICILTALCIIAVAVIGLKRGLPTWAFPSTAAVICIFSFIIFSVMISTVGLIQVRIRIPIETDYVMFQRTLACFFLYGINYILSIVVLHKYKQMTLLRHQDSSWIVFLLSVNRV